MNAKKIIHRALFVITMAHSSIHAERYAYAISPVVDLAGTSWQQTWQKYPFLPKNNCAVTIPDKWQGTSEICPRLHQLVCHERVQIIREHGDEFLIKVPQIFYQQQKDGRHFHTFWAHKEHFIEESALNPQDLSLLPAPFSAEHPAAAHDIILAMPYYAPELKKSYSAGTRFVPVAGKSEKDAIKVYALDGQTKKCSVITIPASLVVQESPHKRDSFIKLVKQWAHLPNQQKIKYVWGGCSFLMPCDGSFTQCTYPESKITYYESCQHPNENPKNGLDCSGLIVRAAHSVGIPLWYKNTATMLFNLKPISSLQALQEGDIIWYPGHVMIVASLKDNTLIEAGSYQSGFGVIHEIPLHAVFKGINTYQELIQHAQEKKPVSRLTKEGNVQKTIKRLAFLQLPVD